MTDRGYDDGNPRAPPIQFVSGAHNVNPPDDDGVATPVGFQDTPDQWYTSKRNRGVDNPLADAATQRDSQATQPQSMATQAMNSAGASRSDYGPSFVSATGSLSGDSSSERPFDDVDEDETQIIMSSMSQDPVRLRIARHIEEEALDPIRSSDTEQQPENDSDRANNGGEGGSDAESDLSDDMLEQDGDVNGLSSIAKNFQQNEADELHAALQRKPSVHVYKPRGPFQASPRASVIGDHDKDHEDSSGAETEVEEEPETTQTFGSNRTDQGVVVPATDAAEPPPILTVSIKNKEQPQLRLGKRSVSETPVTTGGGGSQSEDQKAARNSLDRSASCSEVDTSPERSKRPRFSLESSAGRKQLLLSRVANQNQSESTEAIQEEEEAPTTQPLAELAPAPSDISHTEVVETGSSMIPAPPHVDTTTEPSETPKKSTPPARKKPSKSTPTPTPTRSPPVRATPAKANRKRKLSLQASSEIDDDEPEKLVPPPAKAEPASVSPPKSTNASLPLRIMFTGLDGTIPMLRDKVKKITNASQEDDDVESVTHLVAQKNLLKRTVKLLCGISCCDHILDEQWLDESARNGVPANEEQHCLKDTKAEAKWHFSLYHTMYKVPKPSRRTLFHGLRFFITNHKSVLPPVNDLVKIVQCAGGHAEIKGSAAPGDLVITSDVAMALATTKKAIAQADPNRIYTSELILSSILQQQIDLDAHRLTPPEAAGGGAAKGAKKRTKR